MHSYGQTTEMQDSIGLATIEYEDGIEELVDEKIKIPEDPPPPSISELEKMCNGTRVQVFYNKKRELAQSELERFQLLFPETISNLVFIAPEYKVKVGYFASREVAEHYLKKLKVHFPLALIVHEKFRCRLLDY